MPRRLFWLVSLTLISTLAQAVPPGRLAIPGILGGDDRSLVEKTGYPWGAIGRVNNTMGPFCTGTLIGPRQVLTAAHCLWNRRTRDWLPPCALHFLAGYQRGSYLAHSLVVSYELADGEAARRNGLSGGPTKDWAVLTLADDLADRVSPLATLPLDATSLPGYRQQGVASWYGPGFHGKKTANGETYDMYAMTAAHKTLPLPSYARVTNLTNGRSVVVRINDRGPFVDGRIIDLSAGAAKKLGFYNKGTARVLVEAVELEG